MDLFAGFGGLLVGFAAGLAVRRRAFVGDRRRLNVLAEQLATERRMMALTHRALSEMNKLATGYPRSARS
jgi:hypothetical protein